MLKENILPKVIFAIIAGILCGLVFPEWIARIFSTFQGLFNQFLEFLVPLLVIGLIVPGVAELGKSAGRLLLYTILLAYGFTLLAGFFTYEAASLAYPFLLNKSVNFDGVLNATQGIAPYFTFSIPSLMDITTTLVLSFTLGLGIALVNAETLKKGFEDLRLIVYKIIRGAIVPLLPWYVFSAFLNMTLSGQISGVLSIFAKMIVFLFILTLLVLLLQFAIAGLVAHKNPIDMLRTMLPAYFTALGTSSSVATIPVTYNQVQALGVREGIAGFTVPLCASIHMSGSTVKITACAMAIILLTGGTLDFWNFAGFICMLGVAIVAGPGVPGGAIMASLGVLQKVLGFNDQMIGLMITLYVAMDSFGTACNVTGDGAISVIIEKLYRKDE